MKIERFKEMLIEIEKERGIKEEVLMAAIKDSLLSAAKKRLKNILNLEVRLSDDGIASIFAKKIAKSEVVDETLEIDIKEAKKLKKDIKEEEEVEYEVTPKDFGRLAAQTAKQVIIQRLREAEKDKIFGEFTDRVGDLITGTIQRKEHGGYLVNLGKVETFLPHSEQIPGELLREREHVKLLLVDVKKTSKGPLIVVSRSHPDFVKKLFELEIPEIQEGILEIKTLAREAGRRTKVAVLSNDKNVGAVGTCVGPMGQRIQSITRELGSERVDIIEWSDKPAKFISNSLSPAKISKVVLNTEGRTARVIIPEKELSLAIGKEGQNVRLAAKLTGYKIDIISQEQAEKEEENASKEKTSEKNRGG
ncbi:MAG: transcription termination factor NusA [Candidatus Margulisiibacteriota bacterium]|nr:transcription termination factor NusA [Candidatus Margulisiibacteriota bacterium]